MRQALWALGVSVTLLIALLVVRTFQGQQDQESGSLFDTTEAVLVVRFEVATAQENIVLEKQAGMWVVSPEGIPVDSARVGQALRPVLRVVKGRQVSTTLEEARLREFGLDSVNAKHVKWTLASGETRHVILGNTSSADFNSTYWKHPDQPGVYLTPGNFTHDIPSSLNAWLEIRLPPSVSPSNLAEELPLISP
jgi:G:T/U-mismatch repair DNA glycosylase